MTEAIDAVYVREKGKKRAPAKLRAPQRVSLTGRASRPRSFSAVVVSLSLACHRTREATAATEPGFREGYRGPGTTAAATTYVLGAIF